MANHLGLECFQEFVLLVEVLAEQGVDAADSLDSLGKPRWWTVDAYVFDVVNGADDVVEGEAFRRERRKGNYRPFPKYRPY